MELNSQKIEQKVEELLHKTTQYENKKTAENTAGPHKQDQ